MLIRRIPPGNSPSGYENGWFQYAQGLEPHPKLRKTPHSSTMRVLAQA